MKSTGTREWAAHSANILNGCSHNCLYCYAHAMSVRFGRLPTGGWKNETLKPGILQKSVVTKKDRVMYPTAHDITPQHLPESIAFIEQQLAAGNHLLIVSKPHLKCVEEICRRFVGQKGQITFRFSIGSIDDAVLSFWEPRAPGFDERLECLKWAHAAGFKTGVSVEPMLEGDIDRLVQAVSPYVNDSIWLGKINRLRGNLTFNGYTTSDVLQRAERLEQSQNDDAIRRLYKTFKSDPKVKFKESIKRVVGLKISSKPGADK